MPNPFADKARRANALVRSLRRRHLSEVPVVLTQLGELLPRMAFSYELPVGTEDGDLTLVYPHGAIVPRGLRLAAGRIIEVRPDSLAVVKDRDGTLAGDTSVVLRAFQHALGLTSDGILGPVTKNALRGFAVISNGNLGPKRGSAPKPRSAWERLMEDD